MAFPSGYKLHPLLLLCIHTRTKMDVDQVKLLMHKRKQKMGGNKELKFQFAKAGSKIEMGIWR